MSYLAKIKSFFTPTALPIQRDPTLKSAVEREFRNVWNGIQFHTAILTFLVNSVIDLYESVNSTATDEVKFKLRKEFEELLKRH